MTDPTHPPLLNPYLDLFEKFAGTERELLTSIRRKIIWAYAWAIPNSAAIATLRDLSPLLEIGAGTGYWAWLIRQAGGDVVALDANAGAPPLWSDVLPGSAGRIRDFPGRTLMLCWPPDRDPMASDCLSQYTGRFLVFIGEEKDGVTGDALFHEMLARDFILAEMVLLPRWPGCRDALFVFERK